MRSFRTRCLMFTDLDGALLDGCWDIRGAGAAMDTLHELGCICIPVASRTQPEMDELNKARKFPSPYIFENGTGIRWPSDTQPQCFGRSAGEIYDLLDHIREEHGLHYRSLRDISSEELQNITGLDEATASAAKQRIASVPLVWEDSPQALARFTQILGFIGLQVVCDRQFEIVSDASCSKALAMQTVIAHFCGGHGKPKIIACANPDHGLEMLAQADIALLFSDPKNNSLTLQHPCLHRYPAGDQSAWLNAVRQALELQTLSTAAWDADPTET